MIHAIPIHLIHPDPRARGAGSQGCWEARNPACPRPGKAAGLQAARYRLTSGAEPLPGAAGGRIPVLFTRGYH